MGRLSIALTSLAVAALFSGSSGARAAVRTPRSQPRSKVARKATAPPSPRRVPANTPSSRLCSAARGPAGAAPEEKTALEIPEMRDLTNVATVVQALQGIKGVKHAVADLNTHLAVVDYDPRVTELDHFLAACKEAGFDASEYRVESRFPKPIKLKGG